MRRIHIDWSAVCGVVMLLVFLAIGGFAIASFVGQQHRRATCDQMGGVLFANRSGGEMCVRKDAVMAVNGHQP